MVQGIHMYIKGFGHGIPSLAVGRGPYDKDKNICGSASGPQFLEALSSQFPLHVPFSSI